MNAAWGFLRAGVCVCGARVQQIKLGFVSPALFRQPALKSCTCLGMAGCSKPSPSDFYSYADASYIYSAAYWLCRGSSNAAEGENDLSNVDFIIILTLR